MTSKVTLDIDTKIVSPTQRIWAVFPGLSRRFLGTFLDENVIFLDVPDIRLNLVAVGSVDILRRHVAMSLAWKAYYLGHREDVPSAIQITTIHRNPHLLALRLETFEACLVA
jgi:hypothetical protein